jgi:signal transduction histidine kinase/DNA-binding response OmpR family regulator/ligand-binding sensor domain-containing protein
MYLRMLKNSRFKKITFILKILVFGLFFLISQNLHSHEIGYKYFKNYSYKEYDHHPQNWGMAQAENGIIYVANNWGVLEFDGVSWRVINVPNYTVRSLTIDECGTVYIGGKGEIGYLAPDKNGSLRYESLLNYLNENQKKFSNVWRTIASKEGVYFCPSELLLRWNPKRKQMKVWEPTKPTHRFLYSFTIKERLFIHRETIGLMHMVNDSLVLFSGDPIFTNERERIIMITPYGTGIDAQKLLIGIRSHGFFLYDGNTMTPFPTEVDAYLRRSVINHGIRLSSGDFALATRFGGLVIIDSNGGLKYIFDKTFGLQDEDVKNVFQDSQGNLWLCLDNGISKIEYTSPFSIYDNRFGLPGNILSVTRHHSDLYVGTTKRLYVSPSDSKTFYPVPGISSSCWSLLSIEDSILAATSEGVFFIKKNIKQKVINDLSFVLVPSQRYPNRTWCGTNKGLIALSHKNGQWIEEQRFEIINQDIRAIAENRNGNLWLATSTGGVLKVDFPVSINNRKTQPVVTWYETSHGLPGGLVYPAVVAGHIMFATERGIFRFDKKKNRFIPDRTIGEDFAGGRTDSRRVFHIIEDKNKSIWIHSQSRNYQVIPQPSGTFRIYSRPFRRIPIIHVNTIYPDPDGKTIWFASFDGLIRYDTTVRKNYRQPFKTLIRKVFVNERLIFDGCRNKTSKAPKGYFPVFEYKDRNLRFEFAATFFEAETETHYQCLMEGYDDNWSAWDKEGKRNYANLDSGLYTFRVRAKNIYEHQGEEDVFRFKVLPPWYKTWWAFLLYGFGFFLLMFVVIKWRSIRLEHERQKLEHIIKERTREIMEKSVQLEEQSEKLKEMDKIKSRFFANISHEFRTPLTLIMSPLEEMISESQDKKQKEKYKVMLRYSQQLLTYINQLLDLSRFDSGKMKLQAAQQNIVPFLKGAMASFHMMAQKNKLELSFQSKEEDVSIYFDPTKIEEAMNNLLINAIKFTPTGGRITVSVSVEHHSTGENQGHPKEVSSSQNKDFVEISVRDTGIGMPKEQLENIFDLFYQAESYKEKGHKGTGIGLTLTREIINLHHGKIDVHSQEGKGTEFVIRLPMGHDHLKKDEIVPLPEIAPHRQEPKQIGEIDTFTEKEAEIETGEGDEAVEIEKHAIQEDKTEAQEKNVILVVEDNRDMRKHIRSPLDPLYTVEEAGDGKEGISKAKEIIPDLIVSDIMMPKKDGYELCQELKNDINTSHIPIILLTAKASEDNMIQGLETGADDYITKPFNSKMLLTRIKNLIDLRRQLQLKIQRQKMLLPDEISVSSMDEKFFKEFRDVLKKNLADPDFNVDTLCRKLYMGRSTLFRKVQALTGESPPQFILSYRLERAAQLLKDNFGNVTEVAFEVGFSSPAYFSKCFKEKFHQSPSSFQATEAPQL